MYHQFKDLADVDITKEPMEVGPTCHYMMGGVRVDPETQESTVPGLFAAGECGGGLHGTGSLGVVVFVGAKASTGRVRLKPDPHRLWELWVRLQPDS